MGGDGVRGHREFQEQVLERAINGKEVVGWAPEQCAGSQQR